MSDLKIREEKIKEKNLNMSRKGYVQTICSRVPLIFYKNTEWLVSRYPDVHRIAQPVKDLEFMVNIEGNINKWLDYDFSKNFFENMGLLFNKVQLPALSIFSSENSNYGDAIGNSKNCYLSYSLFECENILYSYNAKYSRNVFNSVLVRETSENIYYSSGIIKSYAVFYSKYIVNSSDIRFSSNLQWCTECIFCDNLLNQSYCIKNKKYEKEEYEAMKKDILQDKENFAKRNEEVNIHGMILWGKNNTGWFIIGSENVTDGYFCESVKNVRNAIFAGFGWWYENLRNVFNCGGGESWANIYWWISNAWWSNDLNNILSMSCSNCYYTYYTMWCSYCIGCIGLKNKSFCILNKEYNKEERFVLADKIFQQMDKDGILWEFFPWTMNPFYFNDTVASLIEDFTKADVSKTGYLRRDEEIKVDIPPEADIVETKNLSSYQWFENDTWTINPEILKKVIKDEKGNYYRIVKMEYDFLMKYGLPLPELHRLERIKLWFKFK